MQDLSVLYEAIKRRECILFLGAGAHYPPPADLRNYQYPEADRPPLGTQLSHTLLKECRKKMLVSSRDNPPKNKEARRDRAEYLRNRRVFLSKHKDNLQRISWFYESEYERPQLINRILQAVDTKKKPSAVVRALAELDFPIVITTNYDQIFEKALGLCGKTYKKIIYDPNLHQSSVYLSGLPKADECWLFKIHGCASVEGSIVVTDEDYIHFIMRMNASEEFHPIPQKLRTQLTEWPTLFVGYSLLDYNLRMLFRTLRWRLHPSQRPPTFSLDLYPDMLIEKTYGTENGKEKLVTFIAEDIWQFVPSLYDKILGKEMPK